MSSAPKYRIVIEPLSDEDGGGFLASAPDLPGCISDGATPSEALTNIYDAMECWIEAMVKLGRPLPKPSERLMTA